MKRTLLFIIIFFAIFFLIVKLHHKGYSSFDAFNASKINGLIQQVGSRSKSVGFILSNNLGIVYYFRQNNSVRLNYPDFQDMAEVGDSVSKDPNGDSLFLFKFGSHEKYSYPVSK
jgi:hypothetical protein